MQIMVEHTGDDPGRASSATNTTASKRAAGGRIRRAAAKSANGSAADPARRRLGRAPQTTLSDRRPPWPFAPMSADAIHDTLKGMDDVEILRRVRPKGLKGLGAGAPSRRPRDHRRAHGR